MMMKTKTAILSVASAAALLTACGQDTVIPDNDTIQENLRAEKYIVNISSQDIDGGSLISAISGSEYLKFVRVNSADECTRLYEVLTNANPDAEVSWQVTNDEAFGNIIICGTKAAVKAAGIKGVK